MAIFSKNTEYHNALPIGYRINQYRIDKILGSGGFGITYLAYDTQLDCNVALKEYLPNDIAIRADDLYIHPKSVSDTTNFNWGLNCFMQEAKTLAQFNHPNIIRIRTFFEELNTAYIVMDYEQGDSLDVLIQDGETAEEDEIETILKPLLDGLALVHQAKCLHRDIKPANIYIRSQDNSPVLLDFGSARYDVSSRSRSMTTIVTPGYAPFEQYESRSTMQGDWTDIYAMGAVLYRLISAKAPPEAPERAGAIMRGKPDPLIPAVKVGKGRYPKHLLEAIDWALKINETERPQTIAAWREKLFPQISSHLNYFMIFLLLIILAGVGGFYVAQFLTPDPEPDFQDITYNEDIENRALEQAKTEIQQTLKSFENNIVNAETEAQAQAKARNAIDKIKQKQSDAEQQGLSPETTQKIENIANNAIDTVQRRERERLAQLEERQENLVGEAQQKIQQTLKSFENNIVNAETEAQAQAKAREAIDKTQEVQRDAEQQGLSPEQIENIASDAIETIQQQKEKQIAEIQRRERERQENLVRDAKHKIQQIQSQAERSISSFDSEYRVNNIADNAISEIQQIQNRLRREGLTSIRESQVTQKSIAAISEIRRLKRRQIAAINEGRCEDGRLNAAQIRKLVTGKIAVGKRINVSTPYLWREGQANGGHAFFRKEGKSSIAGRWKISGNKLCWCYGECEEYGCKYVEARNNCSVWYYVDIESGEKTGRINRWVDYID